MEPGADYVLALKGNQRELYDDVKDTFEQKDGGVLDTGFREDESRVRKVDSAENLSILRRLAMNLLKQDKSVKVGVEAKRKRAGWDEKYLLKILSQ